MYLWALAMAAGAALLIAAVAAIVCRDPRRRTAALHVLKVLLPVVLVLLHHGTR